MSKGKKGGGEKTRKARWMWIEQIYIKLDGIEGRLKLVEKFLGGQENIKKVLENCKKQKTQT
jgi:hypothetical protein